LAFSSPGLFLRIIAARFSFESGSPTIFWACGLEEVAAAFCAGVGVDEAAGLVFPFHDTLVERVRFSTFLRFIGLGSSSPVFNVCR
jgi:hypothetical protein